MRMKPSLRALVVGVAVTGMMCMGGGGAYAVTRITNSVNDHRAHVRL